MGGIFSKFMTDKKAEQDGVWFKLVYDGEEIVNDDGTVPEFKLSRIGTTNRTYLAKLQPVLKRTKKTDSLLDTLDVQPEIVKIFCECCLKDWKNFKDTKVTVDEKSGKQTREIIDIPFSVDTATKLLNDMPELFTWLTSQASEMENFLVKDREENLKN